MLNEQQLDVQGLIDKLMTLPRNAKVFSEGCDCIGEVISAVTLKDGSILLTRPSDGGPNMIFELKKDGD